MRACRVTVTLNICTHIHQHRHTDCSQSSLRFPSRHSFPHPPQPLLYFHPLLPPTYIIHSKSPLLLFKKSPFAQQRRVDELKLVQVPYYGSAVSLELIDLIISSERAGSWHSIQSNLKSHSPRLYLLNGIAPPTPYPTCGVTDGCGVHWMASLRQIYRGEAIRWKIVD